MIELKGDRLEFRFPEVHEQAVLTVEFQRTLRIPDDDTTYALPPGLGRFPVRHVDDFAERVPPKWMEHGGVMFPMYQSEAMWVNFSGSHFQSYPFAVKIAAGKINAVTGDEWIGGLHRGPQDYVIAPRQPWIDGYCVEKGVIKQFIAMPLGSGYSAEEQITGEAAVGGLQIIAYPMKAEAYRRLEPPRRAYSLGVASAMLCRSGSVADMGLAPGGRMRQEIYTDEFDIDDWDLEHSNRCFVHIANSLVWSDITGRMPPTTPPTAREYTEAGLPWFDYYADGEAVDGSGLLDGLKSVFRMGKEKGDVPLPENQSVTVQNVVKLRRGLKKEEVREGRF